MADDLARQRFAVDEPLIRRLAAFEAFTKLDKEPQEGLAVVL